MRCVIKKFKCCTINSNTAGISKQSVQSTISDFIAHQKLSGTVIIAELHTYQSIIKKDV